MMTLLSAASFYVNHVAKPPSFSMPLVAMSSTIIQPKTLFSRDLFIVRDDLQCNPCFPSVSGNKIRKFYNLINAVKVPPCLLSYGGTQSNSMAALASIAAAKEIPFFYIVKQRPTLRNQHTNCNLKRALDNGMHLIEVDLETYRKIEKYNKQWQISDRDGEGTRESSISDIINTIKHFIPAELDVSHRAILSNKKAKGGQMVHWVPQGGAYEQAEEGVQILAHDIFRFIAEYPCSTKNWKVIVSSATGTTALFLSRALAQQFSRAPVKQTYTIEVLAVPCVGDARFLLNQMQQLDDVSGKFEIFPTIVSTCSAPKRHFAHPCATHYHIWKSLKEDSNGIEFDLLYAPRAFEILLHEAGTRLITTSLPEQKEQPPYLGQREYFCDKVKKAEPDSMAYPTTALASLYPNCKLVYYHCGGTEGNPSMLSRYNRTNMTTKDYYSSTGTS